MRLIVDSGSTKTDWIAIDDNGSILFETFTLGLNPQVLTEYIIEERIINNYDLYQNRKKIKKIHFSIVKKRFFVMILIQNLVLL